MHALDSEDGVLAEALAGLWGHNTAAEYNEVLDLIRSAKWGELAASDQLTLEMSHENAFVGFNEGPLKFPPT